MSFCHNPLSNLRSFGIPFHPSNNKISSLLILKWAGPSPLPFLCLISDNFHPPLVVLAILKIHLSSAVVEWWEPPPVICISPIRTLYCLTMNPYFLVLGLTQMILNLALVIADCLQLSPLPHGLWKLWTLPHIGNVVISLRQTLLLLISFHGWANSFQDPLIA